MSLITLIEVIGGITLTGFCLMFIESSLNKIINVFKNLTVAKKFSTSQRTSKTEIPQANIQFGSWNETKSQAAISTKSAVKADFEETEPVFLDINGCDQKVAVDVKNAAVVYVRYYKNESYVTRHISWIDRRLDKKLGRLNLKSLALNKTFDDVKFDIIRKTRQDVNDLINYAKNGVNDVKRKAPESPTSEKEVVIPALPSSVSTEPPKPVQQEKVVRKTAKSIYKGVMVWHGMRERHQGKKTFEHYGLDFIDDESKLVDTVWGEDLKRAISSCNAKEGDYIEIFKLPKKQLEGDGSGKTFMNRWHVIVLKSA